MGKAKKAKASRKKVKDLSLKDGARTVGGVKSSEDPTKYMVLKLNDVLITGV
jgi:hypothetical protein